MRKYTGLTEEEIKELEKKYGKNELSYEKQDNIIIKIFKIICEPMFLLLLISATIYFILGEARDGIIMLVFVVGIISIDVIQEWKTDKTLNALKKLSNPTIKVIREGKEIFISSIDLLPGDLMILYEGVKVPADGIILGTDSISINEALLTGESVPLNKEENETCFAGTLVVNGSAIVKVTKIGNETEYGKIGKNIATISKTKTPLEKQTEVLIKTTTILAFIFCILVIVVTYFNLPDYILKERIIASILSGITLAMTMIPEEYPVVLTVFLAMGAWRLATKKSLVKKMSAIETLGAVTTLCVDKTGTLTKNEMIVESFWSTNGKTEDLFETVGLCCNENTFDPMEQALISKCEDLNITVDHLFGGSSIKKYPFSNETKMMGASWKHDGLFILAAKGSYESIKELCNLTKLEEEIIDAEIDKMSHLGLRVIAVAKRIYKNESEIPNDLLDAKLEFRGIVGLIDPPREGIKKYIKMCHSAGIKVMMITGDNGETAKAIAESVGIENDKYITGKKIDTLTDEELKEEVKNNYIFSRVTPTHKMKIVAALKDNNEVVAMTGDGVNDAPALKLADIGIAMGNGSEVAKEASDLILMDEDFDTIVKTIKDGRRIYDNIKKAIHYIIAIHIPIALISLISPLLKINPSDLFLLPLHIVLLELIIDPTCSIVFEREKEDDDIMERAPRKMEEKILTLKGLITSIMKGLVIFVSSFLIYYISYKNGVTIETARTMGLLTIIYSNLFLVITSSSSIINGFKNIIKDKIVLLINLAIILMSLIITYTPVNHYLKLEPLHLNDWLLVLLVSSASLIFYEIIKIFNKNSR